MASLSSANFTAFRNQLSEELGELSNVAADVTTTDTRLYQLHLVNTTAGALTVTLTDRGAEAGGADTDALKDYSIGAKGVVILHWPEGLFLNSGFSIVASAATGVNASYTGWYK